MRYAALGVLGVAFVLQLVFVYWMNSDVDRTPRRSRDPWLANEGTAHIAAIMPPQANRDRYRATNPQLGQEIINGYVYHAEGTPAAGALLVVEQRDLTPEATLSPNSRAIRWSSTSDARGYFLFDTLPAGAFIVSAFGESTHALDVCTLAQHGAAAEVKLKLEPSTQIRGQVLNAAGEPLANATVYPLANGRGKAAGAYRYFPARTDKQGHFSLELLSAGDWDLLVTARGEVPTLFRKVAPAGQDTQLKMTPGTILAGQVKASGDDAPLASTALTAVEAEFGLERYQARTDKQGRYQFERMRPADYVVRVNSNRWTEVEAPPKLSARAGAPETTILVEKTGALRGRVIAPAAETAGVSGVMVRAIPRGKRAEEVRDETDLGGYYFFPGLKAGEYDLTLQLPEQYAQPERLSLPATVVANQRAEGPTFTVSGSMAIVGIVRDETGASVAGANVHVSFRGTHGKTMSARSGKDGSFRFKGIGTEDTVTMWAEKLGRQSETFGPVEVGKAGLNSVELKLALANGGAISGRVVNAQGAGIEGAPVACIPAGDTKAPELEALTDAGGAFEFQGLPAAAYTLRIARNAQAEGASAERNVAVGENQRVGNVEVVLP